MKYSFVIVALLGLMSTEEVGAILKHRQVNHLSLHQDKPAKAAKAKEGAALHAHAKGPPKGHKPEEMKGAPPKAPKASGKKAPKEQEGGQQTGGQQEGGQQEGGQQEGGQQTGGQQEGGQQEGGQQEGGQQTGGQQEGGQQEGGQQEGGQQEGGQQEGGQQEGGQQAGGQQEGGQQEGGQQEGGQQEGGQESSDDEGSSSGSDSESEGEGEHAHVQLGDYFFARDIGRGTVDAKYLRVPPPRFAADSDDLFMRSMIMTYAAEAKDDDGVPTGNFSLNKASAERACTEVVKTHLKLDAAAAKSYIGTYFPRTFAHFDVNGTGFVPVETMPQMAHFILSDQYAQLT